VVFIHTVGFLGRLLCRIGIHKWSKARVWFHFDSNVMDKEFICRRCGKRKRKSVPVKGE